MEIQYIIGCAMNANNVIFSCRYYKFLILY